VSPPAKMCKPTREDHENSGVKKKKKVVNRWRLDRRGILVFFRPRVKKENRFRGTQTLRALIRMPKVSVRSAFFMKHACLVAIGLFGVA